MCGPPVPIESGRYRQTGSCRHVAVIRSDGTRCAVHEAGQIAVAIAAVVGKPDALRTEIVKAFIVLKAGFSASEELAIQLQAFVRGRLSAHECPREIAFVSELPLTTTRKVVRRLLRRQAISV
jgi:acyl-coenzyme A synthetase/AMP-(fatty) acid ligase